MNTDPASLLRSLFDAAVEAAQPAAQIGNLPPPPRGRTVVIGAGKTAAAMAQALEAAMDAQWPASAPVSGLVITRYGHVPAGYVPRRLRLVEAAHPVPDNAGVRASAEILAHVSRLTVDDLVICLISGGCSALLSKPLPGLSLADKQGITAALLRSGATIAEMNTVRKHLSAIKGGRLAMACAPAQLLTLLISDVPGDAPEVIGSGPTLADPSTCDDALSLCKRYDIDLPPAAFAGLVSGSFETPKPGDPRLAMQEVRVLATPRQSLEAAASRARAAGIAAHVLGDDIVGESHTVGGVPAALASAAARYGAPFTRPCVLLSGGETTVTVVPGAAVGQGGRATAFLLGCALQLQGEPGVWALAADTDGIDGSGPHAGALLTPDSLARATDQGMSTLAHLEAHNSASFFAALGDLLQPGPTNTNVNDFRALLIL